MSDFKREAVAHRWLRNDVPAETWTAGVPSERQFEAQRICSNIEGVTWTVEYAYSAATLTDIADKWQRDAGVSDLPQHRQLRLCANELRTLLRGDGKGEGELNG